MDGTTAINIDYYEELKAKADKWDEKEKPYEPTNLFYIDMSIFGGGEESEGECKCGQCVSQDESYCHNCGQRLAFV